MTPTCTERGCTRPHRARGLCSSHYNERHGRAPRKPVEQTCAQCGATFHRALRTDTTHAFCAMRCRDLFTSARERAAHEALRAARSALVGPVPRTQCPVPMRHPSRRALAPSLVAAPTRRWVAGDCRWCGQAFLHNQPAARYCSTHCHKAFHKAARQARQGLSGGVAPWTRRAVYERDAGVCQLCYGSVDMTLPTSHAWAPTLDHVRCTSWGEARDDSPENLRLAHRWCNSVRSDESHWTFDAGQLVPIPS